ncbi:MAG: rod shape-determining protein RodA [Treponema sp.]|jgi:rod shape determining protein RodA|nr:rod shape-determining protein RodA [Treponema sp.]
MRLKDVFTIDFSLLFASLSLTTIGILFIYSSGITSVGTQNSDEWTKQIVWASIGLVFMLAIAFIDYRRLRDLVVYLYLGALALLIYTFLFGKLVNGARAWIGIGSFGIQPSEFTKITTILCLARYMEDTKRKPESFIRFLVSCVIVFVPMLIILIQPDFGTALVFIPILLIMCFITNIRLRYIVFLILCIGLTCVLMILPIWFSYVRKESLSPVMLLVNLKFITAAVGTLGVIGLVALVGYLLYRKTYFFWIVYMITILAFALSASFASHKVLKNYQIMRLSVFLDPSIDPQGAGWNIIQSVIAIGSGGLQGKGFLHGTQSHYRFLPEQSTDFIFSIFSEEWGFVGGIFVFACFLLICLRLVRIIRVSVDVFGASIAAGLSGMYCFHFLINVGMTMGVMPITGIPLTFMSYGGSALLSAMIGLGLAQSIFIRRFEH